jgi:hypothetical protein
MKPIADLVAQYKTTYRVAKLLGKTPTSVIRWVNAGALIDEHGNVWIQTAKTNYKGEEK